MGFTHHRSSDPSVAFVQARAATAGVSDEFIKATNTLQNVPGYQGGGPDELVVYTSGGGPGLDERNRWVARSGVNKCQRRCAADDTSEKAAPRVLCMYVQRCVLRH